MNGANGWDGTFNGSQMPSTDYWFTVEYPDPNANGAMKEFKAHFSLKR
ncbi:T9SS type B sorting domain-containing protein [Flavobacterium selenitireducens]